jgi:NADH-quinone oxidoreductase subunit J
VGVPDLVFYALALLGVVSGAIVVFSRNVVRAGFALLFTLFAVGGLYALLAADFLAVTQLLLYVGGILILLLFGAMLTQNAVRVDLRVKGLSTLPSILICLATLALLVAVAASTQWWPAGPKDPAPTTRALGHLFLTEFLLPFEVVSVVLLAALIGAVYLARQEPR